MDTRRKPIPRKVTDDDERNWKQNAEELANLALPVLDAIRANHHPHTMVVIEFDRIVVNEATCSMPVAVEEL